MSLSRRSHVTAAPLQGGELLSHVHRRASIWPHAHTEINARYISYISKNTKRPTIMNQPHVHEHAMNGETWMEKTVNRKVKNQAVEGNNQQDFVAISNSPTLAICFSDLLKHTGVAGDASCPECAWLNNHLPALTTNPTQRWQTNLACRVTMSYKASNLGASTISSTSWV